MFPFTEVNFNMQSWNIETSKKMYEVMTELFSSLNLEIPVYITSKDMRKALNQMNEVIQKTQIVSAPIADSEFVHQKAIPAKIITNVKSVLIISPVGIIRYHIKTVLCNKKIMAVANDNLFRGLADYVKRLFDVVIIDIAKTSTLNDVSSIIDEIKRIADTQKLDTSIFVLISEYDKDLREKFYAYGVDRVIVKTGNWYDNVINEVINANKIHARI